MIELRWEPDGPKRLLLRAGCLEVDLATLSKAAVLWEAWIWLEGLRPTKTYGPVEKQMIDVETKVQHWFALANMSRPAMDSSNE